MKRIILCLILTLLLCSSAMATLTYDGTYYIEHLQEAQSGNINFNPIYLALEEIEADLTSIVAGSADTLDVTYTAGQSITIDSGAVTLTTDASSDSAALAIVHGETGNFSGLTLTNASAYPGIQITSSSTGADITGTSATWSISKAGAITGASVTTTGAISASGTLTAADDALLTGTSYNIQWDASENTLEVLDNSYVAFGTDDDATLQFDGTNFELFAAAADTPFALGGTTEGFDLTYAFETAGQFRTDYDGDFINLTDDMDLRFGTGASSDGDFQLSSSSGNVLTLGQVVADTGTFEIGANGTDIPTKFYAETAGDYFQITGDDVVLEDVSLCIADGTQIQFGDAVGTGQMYLSISTAALTLGQVAAGTGTFLIGADNKGIDTTFYAETAGDYVKWDQDGATNLGALIFEDSVLQFPGANVTYSEAISTDALAITATDHANAKINIGVTGGTTNAIDVVWFSATNGSEITLDGGGEIATFDGVDLIINDDDLLAFGDSSEITIQYDEDGDNDLQVTGDVSIEGTTPLLTVGDGGDEDAVIVLDGQTTDYYVGFDTTDEAMNIGVGVAPGTTPAIEINTSAQASFPSGVLSSAVVVTDAAEYDVLAANSGKVHIILDLSQNTSIDLPAEAAGLYYEFWYCGAEEAHDHTLDTENNTNFFIGGVGFTDTDNEVSDVASNGSSNSKLTINDARSGTLVKVVCDGTNWYMSGTVVSDTAPAFADQ